ncbi:hypothetical protein IT401_01595 [Candidatus Nomurabacteria bacterium]|nr:hypothetical protein [Candidatus Nomurabacteria bacterium]
MRILFISSIGLPKDQLTLERRMRELILIPETKVKCLTFMHKGTVPQLIAEKAATKKVAKVVLHDSVPPVDIPTIVNAIVKKMNGSSPEFLHFSEASKGILPIITNVASRKALLGALK